jgi:glycosyltransferase involved in cell wall biosynthesis
VWWQHDIPRREWRNVVATALPARAVGTISRSAAAAQEHLRPRRQTFVVRAGIEPPRSPSSDEVAQLRQELQIPAGRFVVGIVARLQRWKGQHHVLAATALLRDRGHDVHCLVVGGDADGQDPEYASALRRQARDLGLVSVVTFTGQVANPAPYLGLMDVAVNASDAEPFGISLLEAMAAGVAAVAVDAGGPAEILARDRGMLVERAAPGEFADAIERLIVEPELRSRLAARGPELVATEFGAERGAREFEAALTALGDRHASDTL